MKKKLKLYIMLAITGAIFSLLNPLWHLLDTIRANDPITGTPDLLLIWAETCIAVAAFAVFISIIIPPCSRFFLGHDSKKADEDDEVFYYVIMTLFVFGLCLISAKLLLPEPRNREKEVTYLCGVLNENLDFSRDKKMQRQMNDICGDPE